MARHKEVQIGEGGHSASKEIERKKEKSRPEREARKEDEKERGEKVWEWRSGEG